MEHWWNDTDRGTFNCWEQILIQCHSVHQKYLHGLACDRTQAPTATGRMSELWPVSVASHSMLNIRLRGDIGTALPHHTCRNKSKHAYIQLQPSVTKLPHHIDITSDSFH